jgi:hypothetical protein
MKIIVTLILLTGSAFGQLTGEARILKEKRDAKVAEIDKIYRAELEKLKLKALQNKDADAAIAISKELGEDSGTFEQVISVEDPLKHIIGRWTKMGSSTKHDGDTLEFVDKNSGFYINEQGAHKGLRVPFRSFYNPKTKEITIQSNYWENKIKLTGDPDILDGNAGGQKYNLSRIK